MKVKYRKKFLKQLSKIQLNIREQIEEFVFKQLPVTTSISESGKIEKLTGYKGFYKVRFGVFRVGIESKANNDGSVLIIRTVMQRKDIYKFFHKYFHPTVGSNLQI